MYRFIHHCKSTKNNKKLEKIKIISYNTGMEDKDILRGNLSRLGMRQEEAAVLYGYRELSPDGKFAVKGTIEALRKAAAQ